MKNILITGGAGFIGRHLINKLLLPYQRHYKIVVIDNLSNYNNKVPLGNGLKIPSSQYNKHLAFYKEDVRNKNKISDIIARERIDTCIHLAAKISVPHSIRDPLDTVDVNLNGTLNLLEICSNNKIMNFIFASSAAVYGKSLQLPLSEKSPTEALSPYAATKVAGEALVSSYRNSGSIQNALSLRIFNVYGRDQNMLYAGVITRFANRLSKRLAPVIYGDGNQTRDFISVRDVVNCIVLAIQAQEKGNLSEKSLRKRSCSLSPVGVFNVGTGIPVTINSLAKKMIRISGLDIKPIYHRDVNEGGEVRHSYANTAKTTKALKFKAGEKLECGLKELLLFTSV
jgi:UDP-glucose 4-epimerase